MKTAILILFLTFLFSGCSTVKSPITATENWLQLLKNNQIEEAVKHMVVIDNGQALSLTNEQVSEFEDEFTQKYQKVQEFSVENMVALSEEGLKPLGVQEGYEVYYIQTSENKGRENMKTFVVKINGQWRIVRN
jgi:hypothetical protein